MATITLKGNAITTSGELPKIGSQAKDFKLVGADLSEVSLANFQGKLKVLNIVPSLDTATCSKSAKIFNEKAGNINDVVVLVISGDLPFAQKRFCDTEGLKNVIPLSSFRSTFADDYGLRMIDGPIRHLNSRAVIILDKNNQVIYREQISEITHEPDYASAIQTLDKTR